jgi:PBP1b-binding outer membrane lipoprotein LpoB
MKKVFLSLAIVAALTVVSCKQADAAAEATADTTVVEAVDTAAAMVDTAAAMVDTAAAKVEAAAEEVKK